VTVSIRPHQIVLTREPMPAPPGDENVLSGVIRRSSYLGETVDYEVEVTRSDVVLRVSAAPGLRLAPGQSVRLSVKPDACVPLAEGGA
jgi:ABC-type Fe3+/spermidine/putrescine transport system ATPase subunit